MSSAPTTLSQIPTIAQLYASSALQPNPRTHPTATARFNNQLSLIRTDITTLALDAIVNAANNSLLGGGGVDGAIHRAAGPGLYDECETLDGCETGSAKITDAYDLPCKKVIHAVGPVYSPAKRAGMHEILLQGCYSKSLDLMVESGCKSIAFSALSTGVYGYPSREAAYGALGAVKAWLEADEGRAGSVERVVFCCFLEKDVAAYEEMIPYFFPPDEVAETGEQSVDGVAVEGKHQAEDDAARSSSAATTEDQHMDGTTGSSALPQAAGESAKLQDDDKALPDLPDVPTQEPTQAGQPEAKKAKLDHD